MSEDIRWMQLSDLHIGSQDYSWTDKTLKDKMRSLLEEGTILHLDFVIITGDIIHRGQMKDRGNVDELHSFLDILSSYAGKIIVTPGNHDYCRNDSRFRLLETWEQEKNKKNIESGYASKLAVDFNECKSLFDKYENVIFTSQSEAIQLEDINVVSMNTSVFSGQPENGNRKMVRDDGRLWICEEELPEYSSLDTTKPTIMIGHHPFEMFDSKCIERLERFSRTCGIKHYFCGHMHKPETKAGMVTQHTSAGLFQDNYNIPSFAIYSIKKRANETLHKESYGWNGEWFRIQNEPITEFIDENKGDTCGRETPFMIPTSEMSDGALRLPYGGGKFNIYVSKDEPGSITIPHKHEEVDEITYVTKGQLFIVIDEASTLVTEGNALLMPKGKFHGLIPASYPCEYLTMSVEKEQKYISDWQKDIESIREMDQVLSGINYGLEEYNNVIKYLSSSVMEVRWEAEAVLNKRLVQENNKDNDYIREAIGTKIRPALRSHDYEKQFFGLSIAYELGIDIPDEDVVSLLKSDYFMITWVCAYYVIKLKKSIDLKKIYRNLPDGKAYQRAIISLLQLIVNHDSSLICEFDSKDLVSVMAFDDIIMYFTVWYTSFTYMDKELDYSKAAEEFQKLFNGEGEIILRGFTNVQDSLERLRQIQNCRGKLLEAVCAYFVNIHSPMAVISTESTKSRIENYLRIIVSEACNLKCVYCHHEGRIDSLIGASVKENQDFDLRELLSKAKELQFSKIKISGGEPLLYPGILSICNDFDFEDIGFTTNGTQIIKLKDEFEKLGRSKLTFNVTLNSLDQERNAIITGADELQNTLAGIDYLIDHKFSVKINSVITSFNLSEVSALISYAARQKINIKLLDLFAVEGTPEEFKHVSISEIKSEVMKKFRLKDKDFIRENDYLTASVMGIKVMIPSRIYSVDCQYNCKMYPCAEGIFGIRVYEDYSCAKCLSGTIYRGGINDIEFNISQVRKELNLMRFAY